jgi:hypothetical protein
MVPFLFIAAALLAQPSEAPTDYEIVKADGTRQELRVHYLLTVRLLSGSLEADRDMILSRQNIRSLCRSRCPAELPARRAAEDTIYWRDGRRTVGHVNIYEGAVGQNGVRVGPLREVERIELGTMRRSRRVEASIRPTVISLSGLLPGERYRRTPSSGEYVVFREPWVTLSEESLTVQGREPFPRREIRFIRHSESHDGRFDDPVVAEDLVVWKDGSRSSGRVLISDGQVRQQGRRPRPFSDVRYIELAPTR